MTNIAKLDFVALDITGKNYLSWVLDAEMHLDAQNLGGAIKPEAPTDPQMKAKAMILLRHHIHDSLKNEYLTIKDPLVLWTNLKERYDHQKTVILPRARYEWIHLRLQDFKSISDYNSAMFRITSQLTLCGETITDKEMLEKTFSTFHASNLILQQQYRERGFTKYSELISCLLVAEQNNELLMKNHETRPVGTAQFPEANVASYNDQSRGRGRGRGHYRGRGHGRGRGRGRGNSKGNYQSRDNKSHQRFHENEKKSKDDRNKRKHGNTPSVCYRCGSENHWQHTCLTPRHLVDLYKQSIKNKEKGVETNFTYENDNVNVPDGHEDLINATHMDADDFLNPNAGSSMAKTNQLDTCNFTYI